jgi:hypothetical protein
MIRTPAPFDHAAIIRREPIETARLAALLLREAEERDGVRYVRFADALALPVAHAAGCCDAEPWHGSVFAVVVAEARRQDVRRAPLDDIYRPVPKPLALPHPAPTAPTTT